MQDKRTIGEKVRQLREAKGWSQGKLSARMGLNNSAYISKLERGQIEKPTFERLAEMARALGVPDWELTGGAPPPGATDDTFLRALGDVFSADQVERIRIKIESLSPTNKRIVERMITGLYEEQEREKAERRAEIQRQRREVQPEPDPPAEAEPEAALSYQNSLKVPC